MKWTISPRTRRNIHLPLGQAERKGITALPAPQSLTRIEQGLDGKALCGMQRGSPNQSTVSRGQLGGAGPGLCVHEDIRPTPASRTGSHWPREGGAEGDRRWTPLQAGLQQALGGASWGGPTLWSPMLISGTLPLSTDQARHDSKWGS